MAKNKKAKSESDGSALEEPDGETHELKFADKPADSPAAHPKAGTTFTIDGQEVTFEAERQLATSASSGISPGVYQIVSMILKPGNRKVFRAIVGGTLYPIREYGTPGEVISKIRSESKEPRKSRKAPVARPLSPTSGDDAPITLTESAAEILADYLSLRQEYDQDTVLSDLVDVHLGPEVRKLKAAREAISRLPVDLLTAGVFPIVLTVPGAPGSA